MRNLASRNGEGMSHQQGLDWLPHKLLTRTVRQIYLQYLSSYSNLKIPRLVEYILSNGLRGMIGLQDHLSPRFSLGGCVHRPSQACVRVYHMTYMQAHHSRVHRSQVSCMVILNSIEFFYQKNHRLNTTLRCSVCVYVCSRVSLSHMSKKIEELIECATNSYVTTKSVKLVIIELTNSFLLDGKLSLHSSVRYYYYKL